MLTVITWRKHVNQKRCWFCSISRSGKNIILKLNNRKGLQNEKRWIGIKTLLKIDFSVVILLRLHCGSLACYILQQYYNWNSFNHAFSLGFWKIIWQENFITKKENNVSISLFRLCIVHAWRKVHDIELLSCNRPALPQAG